MKALFLSFIFYWFLATCFASSTAPKRVVSMNLCTDQLALLLAKPEQLVSVSYLSHIPKHSSLYPLAQQLPANKGVAEEVFAYHADLVLAGAFTRRETVTLLKRLNHRVEVFQPSYSLADIRKNILLMGKVLGSEEKSLRLVSAFDKKIATLKKQHANSPKIEVGSFGANNYVRGSQTLEQDVIQAAGLLHYGSRHGLVGGGKIALERIIADPPDFLLIDEHWNDSPALAYENLQHPALQRVMHKKHIALPQKHWICGTPFITEAIEQLAIEARKL